MISPAVKIRAILFDWDGTLVNSLEVKIKNAGTLFQKVFDLLPVKVEEAYRRHSGIPRRQLFDAILADLGRPALETGEFDSLSSRFSEMNTKALSDPALPGLIPAATPSVLKTLQEKGCFLFISSSAATEELKEIAGSLGLSKYFLEAGGEIMGSYPGFNKGKDHVNHVCQKYGLAREELLFVGDDLSDIRLGHEAGVMTIARVGTYTEEELKDYNADAVVQTLDEITALPGLVFGAEPDQGQGKVI
ncbi:MAG TPA: HAD family hydrolase [Anaerolineales bacterium]|nr:HAD family hydrolase [Anaerolineales bacterium]